MKLSKLLLASMLALPMAANAAIIEYVLDTEFSGAATPNGEVVVSFDDQGTAGSVTMTVDTSGLVGSEHLKNLFINIDPLIGAFGVGGGVNFGSSWLSYALYKDADKTNLNDGTTLKADGIGGYYDMKFDFAFGGGNGMGAGNTFIYDFVGPASLVASSFAFESYAGSGPYAPFEIAAHIGGVGPRGEDSGWVTDASQVPAPASLAIMAAGLLLMGGSMARKNA